MNIKTTFKIFSLISIFCSAAALASAQTVNIQQQGDYTIGTAINTPRFAVGDVNNDRLPDLVTGNQNNLTSVGPISVFLNNGAGGFGSPLNTPNVNVGPTDFAIGDFNRDGNADLAVSQTGIADSINIRLGNGTGNFLTGTPIAAERGSPSIVSADFNGDGNLDLATCNNINELRVLNGNGNGTFAAAASFPTAAVCQDLKTADFNVDGRPDLAVSMRLAPADRGVQTFINNGAGFNAPINNAASGATIMAVADFNRDCIPDLAVSQFASTITTPIYIMLGSGSGNVTTTTTVTLNNFPQQMTVGDFNRDKKVDLAIRHNVNANPGGNNLTILPGNGNGTFGTAFAQSIALPTSTTEMHLATIDANLDGRDDLVVGRLGGFLLFHGNSALFTRTENDYDGDLKTDLSVFRPSNGAWFISRSLGGFATQQWGLSGDKLTPADYDGDGKTDIAVWRDAGFGNPAFSYFFIFRSSTNTLQQEQFGKAGDNPSVVGDWDGDGRADPAVYRAGAAAGDSSFFFYRPSATAGVDFRSIVWGVNGDAPVRGDFDGDGRADATVFRPSTGLNYVLQTSNGQIRYQQWGLATDRRVPADYDGDGRTDFAVLRAPNNDWYILNSLTGTASYRQWGANTDTPIPGDYNGDGKTDVSTYRASENNWYLPHCGDYKPPVTRFGATGDIPVPSAFAQ